MEVSPGVSMSLKRSGPLKCYAPRARGPARLSLQLLQQRVHLRLVQVLVVVEVDLHARPAAARRQALDAAQREAPVGRGFAVPDPELLLEVAEQAVGAHQRAR